MTEPHNLNAKIDKLRRKMDASGFELREEEEERLREGYKVWWNMSAEKLIIPCVRKRCMHQVRIRQYKRKLGRL